MKRFLILISLLLLFAATKAQTSYTFQKTNCNLEVLTGATIVNSQLLKNVTWTQLNAGAGIQVGDGSDSWFCIGAQISNYTGTSNQRVDSLILDLTTWTNACASAVAADVYWEAGTTSGVSPKGDSTIIFEDGSGTIGAVTTTTADSSFTVGLSAISGSTLESQIYGGKSFLGLGNTATGFIFQDDLPVTANFDKLHHFDALGNWTGLGFNATTHLSATGDFLTASGWYMNSYQIDTSNGTAAVKNHLKTALAGADMAIVTSVESTTGNSWHTILAEANDTNKVKVESYVEFSPLSAKRGIIQDWWGTTIFKGAVNQYTFPYSKGTAGQTLILNATADTLEWASSTSQTGWGSYVDTILTQASPQTIATTDTAIITNNRHTVIETYLPTGVDSLFGRNGVGHLIGELGASYSVRINFSAKSSAVTDYASLLFDIGSDDDNPIPISTRVFTFPKGQNVWHSFSFTTTLYALSTFVSNGCKLKIIAGGGTISIADIEFLIIKTSDPN